MKMPILRIVWSGCQVNQPYHQKMILSLDFARALHEKMFDRIWAIDDRKGKLTVCGNRVGKISTNSLTTRLQSFETKSVPKHLVQRHLSMQILVYSKNHVSTLS